MYSRRHCNIFVRISCFILTIFHAVSRLLATDVKFQLTEFEYSEPPPNSIKPIEQHIQFLLQSLRAAVKPYSIVLASILLMVLISVPAAVLRESTFAYFISLFVILVLANGIAIMLNVDDWQLFRLICDAGYSPRFNVDVCPFVLYLLWLGLWNLKTDKYNFLQQLEEWLKNASNSSATTQIITNLLSSSAIAYLFKPTINLFTMVAVVIVSAAATVTFVIVYNLSNSSQILAEILGGLFLVINAAIFAWMVYASANQRLQIASKLYRTRGINIFRRRVVRKLFIATQPLLIYYFITLIVVGLLIASSAGIQTIVVDNDHVNLVLDLAMLLAAGYAYMVLFFGLILAYYAPIAATKYLFNMFAAIPPQNVFISWKFIANGEPSEESAKEFLRIIYSEYRFNSSKTARRFHIRRNFPMLALLYSDFSILQLFNYARFLIRSFLKDF